MCLLLVYSMVTGVLDTFETRRVIIWLSSMHFPNQFSSFSLHAFLSIISMTRSLSVNEIIGKMADA